MLDLICPHCDQAVTASPEVAGTRLKCVHCDKSFKVPGSASAARKVSDDDLLSSDPSPRPSSPRSENLDTPEPIRTSEASTSEFSAPVSSADAEPASTEPIADDQLDEKGLPQGWAESRARNNEEQLGDLKVDDELFSDAPRDVVWTPEDEAAYLTSPANALTPTEIGPDDYFATQCPTCDSRWNVKGSQIGESFRCEDCHASFTIIKPRFTSKVQPAEHHRHPEGDGLQLGEAVDRSHYDSIKTQHLLAESPAEVGEPGQNATESGAGDGAPQVELFRLPLKQKAVPANEWFRYLFKIFMDMETWKRTLGLWLGVALNMMLLQGALMLAASSGASSMLSGPLIVMFLILSALLLPPIGVFALTIVQDTANRMTWIRNWPEFAFLEWFEQSLHLAAALFVAALPGGLLGIVFSVGRPDNVIIMFLPLLMPLITANVIFPFTFMSTMINGSPWKLFSQKLWQALHERPRDWLPLLVTIGALDLIVVGTTGLMFLSPLNVLVTAAVTLVWMVSAMIYFRALGLQSYLVLNRPAPSSEVEVNPSAESTAVK